MLLAGNGILMETDDEFCYYSYFLKPLSREVLAKLLIKSQSSSVTWWELTFEKKNTKGVGLLGCNIIELGKRNWCCSWGARASLIIAPVSSAERLSPDWQLGQCKLAGGSLNEDWSLVLGRYNANKLVYQLTNTAIQLKVQWKVYVSFYLKM